MLSKAQAVIGGNEQAVSAINARMDPMTEAVSDIVRDLGQFNKIQEQTGAIVSQIQRNFEDASVKMGSLSDAHQKIRELHSWIETTLTFSNGGFSGVVGHG